MVRAPELKAFETHTTKAEDEFRRKVRIACECMHVHFTLWPELRRLDAWNVYKYIGHRLLRWIGGYLLCSARCSRRRRSGQSGPFWAIGLPLAMSFGVWMSVLAGIGPGLILWNILACLRRERSRRVASSPRPTLCNLECSCIRPQEGAGVMPPARSGDHKEKA